MHPILFELGRFTVYTYGVLLAAAYLLGLQLAVVAGARAASTARVMDLGIYIIVAALVGAKLLLLVVDFDHFRRTRARSLSLVRSGGVFYGGLILAVSVALVLPAPHGCRSGRRPTRSRPASRSATSSGGSGA